MVIIMQNQLILPGSLGMSKKYKVLGYICRALLSFICLFGIALLVTDALQLELSLITVFIFCAAYCLLFSLMGINRRCFIGGIAVIVLTAFVLLQTERALDRLYFGGVAFANAFFRRLAALGYQNMQANILRFDSSLKRIGATESECLELVFYILLFILAAVIAASILKRIHLVPLLCVGLPICSVIFYYGMNESNLGFSLILSSLCGCIALSGWDHVYTRRKTIAASSPHVEGTRLWRREVRDAFRTNSALGGFVGVGSALVAFVLLLLGPIGINKSMTDIPALSTPLLKIENFVYSMVSGQNPDFSSLIFSGVASIDSRSTTSESRSYTGEQLFRVSLDADVPVYLRGWVGTDYYNDSWHSPTYEKIDEYRRTFGSGFSHEYLTGELMRVLAPSLVGLGEADIADHSDLGYVTALVNVEKLKPTANLVFMPSYSDQSLGLLEYGTRERSDVSYSNYADGIFAGTGYLFCDEYSTVASLPRLTDPEFTKNLSKLTNEFIRQYRIIDPLREYIYGGAPQDELDARYQSQLALFDRGGYDDELAQLLCEEHDLSWRYMYEMTPEERLEVDAVLDNVINYYDYVYKTYLTGCESFSDIEELARTIAYGGTNNYAYMDSCTERHTIVMSIIDFLSGNMTYTLDPEPSADKPDYINAAHSFLFDVREGYCVQFATSAVMLLRSLGIPARYAEGYVASGYTRNSSENAVGTYTTTVSDANAHAWVEVYYDYYGWVQYEATSPYYSEVYNVPTEDESVDLTFPEYDPVETEPIYEETILPAELPSAPKKQNIELPAGAVAAAVALSILAVGIILLICRIKKCEHRRDELMRRAQSLSRGDMNTNIAERVECARALDGGILSLLEYLGLKPEPGELPSEFAWRVDNVLGELSRRDFADISTYMSAAEFGQRIQPGELLAISEYARDLLAYARRSANPIKRLWLETAVLTGLVRIRGIARGVRGGSDNSQPRGRQYAK